MSRLKSVVAWLVSKPLLLVIAVWVVDAAICWLRMRPEERDRIWTDDSVGFLQEWTLRPNLLFPFIPYAGYLNFLPKVASGVITLTPIYYWALLNTAAACILVGSVGAVAFWASKFLVKSWPVRIAVALIPAMLPLAGVEPLGTLCCLHYWAIYAIFWLLFAQPHRRGVVIALVVFTLVWTISETQIIFLVPLALLMLIRSKNLGQRLISATAILGSLAQLVTYFVVGRYPYSNDPQHLPQVLKATLINTFGGTLTSSSALTDSLRTYFGYHGLAALAVLSLVPVVVAFWRGDAKIRLALFYICGLALFLYPFAAYTLKFPIGAPEVPWRWGTAPALCMLATWMIALDQFVQKKRIDVAVATFLVVVLFAVQCVSFTSRNDQRVGGTAWRDFVVAAKAECQAGATKVASPGWPPNWAWYVPCDRLR